MTDKPPRMSYANSLIYTSSDDFPFNIVVLRDGCMPTRQSFASFPDILYMPVLASRGHHTAPIVPVQNDIASQH
jgi:hypothetical protein